MWTINEVLTSGARKYADRVAVVDGGRQTGFAELEAAVLQTAGWLQAQGVGKGDKVAIQGRNSLAWVVAFYATLRAGAVAVPLNHKLAAAETAYILEHSESRLWLVDGDLYQPEAFGSSELRAFALNGEGGSAGLPPFAPTSESHPFTPVDVAADDLAELLYTSGTTGRPKGCMHSHANVLLAGLGSSTVYWLGPSDRVLIAMPVWHSFPLNNLLVGNGTFTPPPQGRFEGNQRVSKAELIDYAGIPLRLTNGSVLRGRIRPPGSARGVELLPDAEFITPAGTRPMRVSSSLAPGAFQ